MDFSTLAVVFVVVLIAIGAGVAAMALGQSLSGRCMRGSCGGPEVVGPDGESLSCRDCPKRKTG